MAFIKKIEVKIESWVKERPLLTAIRAILLTLLICLVLTGIIFFTNLTHANNLIDITKTGPLGDTFNGLLGPFIAFLVAILTFLAFYIQYLANEKQTKVNELLQFESKFFEMIRLHRENVNELKYTKWFNEDKHTNNGRKVFKVVCREFVECKSELSMFFRSKDEKDYYLPNYFNYLKPIIHKINPQIDLIELAKINIAYAIVFFGAGKEGELALRSLFKTKYKTGLYLDIIDYIRLKPKQEDEDRFSKWTKISNIRTLERRMLFVKEFYEYRKNSKYPLTFTYEMKDNYFDNKYDKYYGGHQYRLGHYFRHLFQSYTYLNSQIFLDAKQKYFYGKTLRAQLSNYEQALLLVNSLSSLGMKWEYCAEKELDEVGNFDKKQQIEDNRLITRYNLIKNLPGHHIFGITYKTYYPKVKYESDEQ